MIRDAIQEDIEHLLILGWEMHQESRYKNMGYDLEKVAILFEMAINSDDYLVLVVEKEGQLIGGFIGCVSVSWFGPDLMASDFSLFIHQDYRGGSSAAKMLRRYISWALDKGVKPEMVQAGITTGVHTEETQKLYEAIGFEQMGVLMALKVGA